MRCTVTKRITPIIIIAFQLRLHYHDGSPVRDKTNPVKISYGYTFNQTAYTNISRMLDDNGMIELNFYPPRPENNNSYPLNIEVNRILNFSDRLIVERNL